MSLSLENGRKGMCQCVSFEAQHIVWDKMSGLILQNLHQELNVSPDLEKCQNATSNLNLKALKKAANVIANILICLSSWHVDMILMHPDDLTLPASACQMRWQSHPRDSQLEPDVEPWHQVILVFSSARSSDYFLLGRNTSRIQIRISLTVWEFASDPPLNTPPHHHHHHHTHTQTHTLRPPSQQLKLC